MRILRCVICTNTLRDIEETSIGLCCTCAADPKAREEVVEVISEHKKTIERLQTDQSECPISFNPTTLFRVECMLQEAEDCLACLPKPSIQTIIDDACDRYCDVDVTVQKAIRIYCIKNGLDEDMTDAALKEAYYQSAEQAGFNLRPRNVHNG